MGIQKDFKAQFWSFDIIFAIVIFSVALTILTFTWFNISNQLAISYVGSGALLGLQTQALATSLLSTGSPPNWQSAVSLGGAATWAQVSVGLGSSQDKMSISARKLYTFIAMAAQNYSATKQLLGIGYNYYITITGGPYNIAIGENPTTFHALNTYIVTSGSNIGGTPVIVRTMLWSNKPIAVG
jgi:hypothetical protein